MLKKFVKVRVKLDKNISDDFESEPVGEKRTIALENTKKPKKTRKKQEKTQKNKKKRPRVHLCVAHCLKIENSSVDVACWHAQGGSLQSKKHNSSADDSSLKIVDIIWFPH